MKALKIILLISSILLLLSIPAAIYHIVTTNQVVSMSIQDLQNNEVGYIELTLRNRTNRKLVLYSDKLSYSVEIRGDYYEIYTIDGEEVNVEKLEDIINNFFSNISNKVGEIDHANLAGYNLLGKNKLYLIALDKNNNAIAKIYVFYERRKINGGY